MASSINPLNINGNYPIAGQDNDSQGFRDNFTNIKTNFIKAKDEISDLQLKALLLAPLTGGNPVLNDFNGSLIQNAATQGFTQHVNFPTVNAGAVTIDPSFADFFVINAPANLTMTLGATWPDNYRYRAIRVLVVAAAGITITLPTAVNMNVHSTITVPAATPTVTVYNYMMEFSSFDAGVTVIYNPLFGPV
jgi:hypothetical protein